MIAIKVAKLTVTYIEPEDSLAAQMLKNLPAMRKTGVRSLGWKDLLEKEMGYLL